MDDRIKKITRCNKCGDKLYHSVTTTKGTFCTECASVIKVKGY